MLSALQVCDQLAYGRFSFGLIQVTIVYYMLSVERVALGACMISLLTEISAIFLHSRQLLLMYGFSKRSLVFGVHRILNLGTFTLLRLVPMVYATYCSYTARGLSVYLGTILPFLTTSTLVINFFLLWRIFCSDIRSRDGKDSHVMDN